MERALYVKKYSDFSGAKEWQRKNIECTDIPPVAFKIDGISSKELS